jgi:Prealbumin-like fold domain
MLRSFVTSATLALALTGTFATAAYAQNPYNINGVVPDTGILPTPDPSGNFKELGPVNASGTKVGVINTAAPPMLEFTNPNGQVDLTRIFMDTKRAADGDSWLYFAWQRDNDTGSGFIAFEFQQQALSPSCVYSGTDIDQILPRSAGETALINSCNPWVGRRTGDFLILWDQSGSALNITKRVFTTGVGFGAPQPLGSAVAAIGSCDGVANSNGFCGEAAINLTEDVFKGVTSCLSFSNIIPGTVTGNSDSADYKDTVFAAFPPISNCGSVQVIKETIPAGQTGNFPFTLARSDGPVRFTGASSINGLFTQGGQSATYLDLIPSEKYTLVEGAQVSPWALKSISCKFDGEPAVDVTLGGNFTVGVGETTVCIITNERKQGKLTVIKHMVTDNGGTAVSTNFTMSLNDGVTQPFAGHESPGDTFTFDEGHTFNVTEIGPAGYAATFSGDCSGAIVAGVTKVCTVTNNDIAPTLRVIKQVNNDDGGTAQPNDFKPSVAGVVVVSGATNIYRAGVPLAINETQLTGYEFVSISGAGCPVALGGTITLALDQDATCTITNTDVAPKLTVIKNVINDNGGGALPNDFKLTVNGAPVLSGAKNSYSANAALVINETQLPGYVFGGITGDARCPAALGGSVTLQPGDDITCTITNNDLKNPPAGTTDQSAILRDAITITNLRAGAPDASNATVVFRLYSDAACTTEAGSEGPLPLAYAQGGVVATAATVDGILVDPAAAAPQSGTYRWRVTYSGDTFNTGFTTGCGEEVTTLTFAPK